MAVTEVSSPGVSSEGTSTTPNITHGLTILENDIVVVAAHINNSPGVSLSSDVGNGLTQLYTVTDGGTCTAGYGGIWALYSKKSAGSEPSSYGFTSGASSAWAVIVRVFRGCDRNSWWDVTPGASTYVEDSGTGTTATSTDMTIVTAGALGVMFGFTDDVAPVTQWSSPTNSWTNAKQTSTTYHLYSTTRICPSTGAIGTMSCTLNETQDWQIILGALRPNAADMSVFIARGLPFA